MIHNYNVCIHGLLVRIAFAAAGVPSTLRRLARMAVAPLLRPLVVRDGSLLSVFVGPLDHPATGANYGLELRAVTRNSGRIGVMVIGIASRLAVTFPAGWRRFLIDYFYRWFSIFVSIVCVLTSVLLYDAVCFHRLVLYRPRVFVKGTGERACCLVVILVGCCFIVLARS